MAQVTIYLDDETEARLRQAAETVGLSKSRWIAQLIRAHTAARWPKSVQELAGTWDDFPEADELRAGSGEDAARETI